MTAKQRLGALGEELAARHLQRAGLVVVDRNWRCTAADLRGELDIVARDGATVVFCEVKARRSAEAVDPLEAITPRKLAQLRRLAGAWLAASPGTAGPLRIDAVAVWWPSSGGPAQVAHVRGVG